MARVDLSSALTADERARKRARAVPPAKHWMGRAGRIGEVQAKSGMNRTRQAKAA